MLSLKQLQKIQLNILDKIGKVEKIVGKEGDRGTRGLEVQLLNNSVVVNDISDIDCALIAKQQGKGAEDTFVVPGAKVDNKYEIIYPSNLMKKGIVEAELRFTQGEQILTSFIFEIDMARTLVVEEITDSIYEQRLIDVIVNVVANEDTRIANEEERVSNESTRLSNESERKSNEVERDNQESIRQSNEDARVDEENIRISNESTRETNEGIRESNENTRQTNENTRKSNEVDRVDFFEMLQQMLANGDLNGEVTLAELAELAGEGRTDETVKGNADKITHLENANDVQQELPPGDGTVGYFRNIKSGTYYLNTNTFDNQPVPNGYVHIMKRETEAGVNSIVRIYRMSASSPSETWTTTFGAGVDNEEMVEWNELSLRVESGQNKNGYYIKYGDGTMKVYTVAEIDLGASGSQLIRFPQNFIDNNIGSGYVLGKIDRSDIRQAVGSIVVTFNDTEDSWQIWLNDRAEGRTVGIHLYAIGRWKE